ncbi:MAG: ATP-binding protein [Bacilli bacterium]|nr:ATP-binding protein [Bacilli bacterium]
MEFKRKIIREFETWKNSLKSKRKALVIKGLRQIGKSYIVEKFARGNYPNVVKIDFKKEPRMKACFGSDLNVDILVTNISANKPGSLFVPGKTVLILDEIQECSAARASLKSFMEDGRFDVIATGSLLGIKGYNSKYSGGVSVGFEHTLYMKAMDFEEFLWAIGIDEKTISYVRDCFANNSPISEAVHNAFTRYFREYICVGGLPDVVKKFIETRDMNQVRAEQLDLIEGYKDDFAKHLDENEEEKVDKALLAQINKVFDSLPSQLAKENKKFMVSKIDKRGTLELYSSAIQWLVDYGLVDRCHNLSVPEFPLEGNKIAEIFKIYFTDTGLLVASLDEGAAGHILSGDMGIYKGAVYEESFADAYLKKGKKLYYFSKESGLEIDFILQADDGVRLLEVKAKDGRTKAASELLKNKDKYHDIKGLIRLKDSNVGIVDNIATYPTYMSFLID